MKLLRKINFVLLVIAVVAFGAFCVLTLVDGNELNKILIESAREVGIIIGLILMFAVITVLLFIYTVICMAREGNAGPFIKEFLIYSISLFVFLTIYKNATHQVYVWWQSAVIAMMFALFTMYGKVNKYLKEKGK